MPISVTSLDESLALIEYWVMEWRRNRAWSAKIVVTPNPEIVVAAQGDSLFLRALEAADLSLADGWGVVAACRLLKARSKKQEANIATIQRIAGIELMEALVDRAVEFGWTVMFLGGRPGMAESAAAALRHKFKMENSKFKFVTLAGPQDIERASKKDRDQLISYINQVKPDLIFVGFGHRNQELWMQSSRRRLAVGVMMGVGGALDQLADPTLRPPVVIDSMGFGWLYRLLRQPWRIKRQLVLLKFLWMVAREGRA